MSQMHVKKGEIIQSSGDLNSKIYYVEKGLLRSYTISKKGKEHIFMFAPEGWTIADSVVPEQPCALFIDAIEDSTVYVTEKDPEVRLLNPKKLRKRIWVMQNRIIMLMCATALERYEHFVETYPKITRRVPQKMIASYLGITPEALSKVKGKRIREN